MVAAQDMWWWLRRICGGGSAGYVVGEIKNKANSAQPELELGLSLAKMQENMCVQGNIINCYKTLQNAREMLKR